MKMTFCRMADDDCDEPRPMSVKEMRKAMMAKKKAMQKDPFGDAMLVDEVAVAAPRRVNEETERLKKKEAEDTVRIVSGDGEREFVIPRTAACHSGLLLSLFGRQGDESDEDEVDPLGGEAFPVPYPAGVLDACFAYAMEAPRAPTHA